MRAPHPWLAGVSGVPHGGCAREGLDLSASLAPLGPSPAAVAAARRAAFDAYPEPDAASLTAAVAGAFGLDPDRLVPGAGAADLLLRACAAHLRPGDTAVLVAPCFGEYARAAAACGARTVRWECRHEDGFRPDVEAIARACRVAGAAVGIVARPANPTGVHVPVEDIRRLVAATPDTTWIVDEAFIGLADDASSTAGGDAVTVRSLTKELCLPGLRVAVADAPPAAARALRALAPPWCVSAPASAAAVAGLADGAHRAAAREAVRRGRAALEAGLRALGIELTDSCANYVCARTGDAPATERATARRGIHVRACDDLGLPGWVRVAVPPPGREGEVLDALSAALSVTA